MHSEKIEQDLGCCASIQKWFILIVNLILCICGIAQIGFACYILAAGTDGLGFAAAVLKDNDTAVKLLLAFGFVVVFVSFLGCCGAKRKSKCMLWIYAVTLFFMIMGQSVGVIITAFSVTYGDAIFESVWQTLSVETIEDIENAYECCSFNGDDADDTWPADAENWDTCTAANDWDPMETCWEKFNSAITENFDSLYIVGAIFLGVQVLIYFCTHFVVASIAEVDGKDSSAPPSW